MTTLRNSDQLFALALARVPGRHLRPVYTHEEILLAARRARANAARTRLGLRDARERRAAVHAQTARVQALLQGETPR